MKKILVIAMSALFAVSAFALDAKLRGVSEVKGEWFMNSSAVKKYNNDQAIYYQFIRFWADVNVDDNTSLHFRSTPLGDRVWGTSKDNNAGLRPEDDKVFRNDFDLDRAYVTLTFGDFSASLGRQNINDFYVVRFANLHPTRGASVSRAGDAIKVKYQINSDISVQGYVVKVKESQLSTPDAYQFGYKGQNKDNDLYVLAANFNVGDLKIAPSLGYSKDLSKVKQSRFSYHLGAVYDTPSVEVQAAFAGDMVDQKKNATDWKENEATFGFLLQAAYKTPELKAGALFAYGSASEKRGYFQFGDSFGRTYIVDGQYYDGNGATGMMTAQVFASYSVNPDIDLNARVAYYKSNLPKPDKISKYGKTDTKSKVVLMTNKSSVVEIDLDGSYQLTSSTKLTLGAAYAINNDVYNAKQTVTAGKIKNIMGLRWVLTTEF